MRYLSVDDARAAVWGGLVYGAGGGGLEGGLRSVDMVLGLGRPRLAGLDELDDGDLAVVATGVGAPGSHAQTVFPRDSVRAFELARAKIASRGDGTVRGTIIGHPGAGMVRSWLHSAMDPDVVVVDCATNGRGHPSVRMGGMGVAADLSRRLVQAAVGGLDDEDGRLELVIEGPLAPSSDVVRRAASALGGSIAACRGPFAVDFLKRSGAVGSVGASIALGEAMLAAKDAGGAKLVDAVVSTLGGRVAATGRVVANTVALDGAYDVGTITVDGSGTGVTLAVCNEYLTVELDGERVATFPDLIVLLDEGTGMPVSAAGAVAGVDVIVVVADRSTVPLGAGVWDRAAYGGVEKLLDVDLCGYL